MRAQLAAFIRQYGRKRQSGGLDPNDRRFDRQLRDRIKRMDPQELDELLGDEQDNG
jgi:hypothetical protein